ncbi:hypothetical protein HDK64DRAFT_249584 [Phyllosticta capitalensis]
MAAAHTDHAGRGLGPADVQVPCPDPAAHDNDEKDRKLQEQASTAALYVTSPERLTNDRDQNQDISSASAAASLKHARPADLPSFPIVGIDAANSAGTAALLAAGNKTKIEWWKPDGTPDNALKAALLAHDQKMAPSWKPELSAAGSKAALLAHRDSGKPDNKRTQESSSDGNSAAGIAMRSKGLSAQWNYGFPEAGKMNALTAATGAFAAENRKKSEAPVSPHPPYPDAANSAQSSLSAAALAHAPSTKKKEEGPKRRPESDALQSSRVAHIGNNIPREMYSSSPPVSLEVEEKRRQDALRASAISMANKMYDSQKQAAAGEAAGITNPGETAARVSSNRPRSMISSPNSSPDIRTEALQYLNLQEQAQKLASERLSKIDSEKPSDYRNYYGYGGAPPRKRLSIRRRRRAASEGDIKDSDDEAQAQRVRNQMSAFNKQLAEVDMKKRQKDRESLLAAAERKVHAQMHSIDEKVFQETGKVSTSMMEEWETKARAKAAQESEQRMENHGKVHVGGGKFLDQKDIDEIAAERVHPTLLEIGEAAEAQRARDEEKRLDEAEKKRMEKLEKEREAERKAEEKRIRNEEKASEKTRKAEEKALAKTKKEADKALKKEESRLKKAANRKSKDVSRDEQKAESTGVTDAPKPASESRPTTSGSATERGRTSRPAPVTVPSYRSEVDAIADVSSSEGEDETPGNTIPLPQIADQADNDARPSTTTAATKAEDTTSSAPQKSPLPPFAPTSPVPPTPKFAAPDQQAAEPKQPAPEPTKSHRFKSLLTHLKISRPWTDSASGTAPNRPTTSQGTSAATNSFARPKLASTNRQRPASFIGGAALAGSRSASQNRLSYAGSHASSGSSPSLTPNPGGSHNRDNSRKRTSSSGHRAPGLFSAVLGRTRPSSSAGGAPVRPPAHHRHTLHFGSRPAADVSVSSLSSVGDAPTGTGTSAAAARGRLPRRPTSNSKVSSLSGEGDDNDFFEEARDRFDVDGDVGSMSNASATRSGEADSLSGGVPGASNRSRERGASHGSNGAAGEGGGSKPSSIAEIRRSRIVSGSPVRETRFTERF